MTLSRLISLIKYLVIIINNSSSKPKWLEVIRSVIFFFEWNIFLNKDLNVIKWILAATCVPIEVIKRKLIIVLSLHTISEDIKYGYTIIIARIEHSALEITQIYAHIQN